MLTKEHLRYRWDHQNIVPSFLGSTPFWKRQAEAVLNTAHACVGKNYAELEAELNICLSMAGRSKKAVKGLYSVLEKKVELEDIDELKVESHRELMWKNQVVSLRKEKTCPDYPMDASLKLYPDLLIRRSILSVPEWSVERTLHRYNLALAQGLLIHAEEVFLEFEGMSASSARAFKRYLTFFGLLVDAKGLPEQRCTFHIGGALSGLGGGQRYRMRVASMFGAIPHFTKWRCRAKLNLDKKMGILDLRENSGLNSHYRPHYDYIPPELQAFMAKLNDVLGEDWSAHECSWPDVPLEDWIFPDLLYRRGDGLTLGIDIFFNHQKSSFLNRLSQKEAKESKNIYDRNLILVEKKCLDPNKLGCSMADIIIFNGIPSAMKVSKWLNKDHKKS